MKKREYIFTSLKLFILYIIFWAILSSFNFSYFILILLLIFSFVTPLIFTLHLENLSFFKGIKLIWFFIFYSIKSGLIVASYTLKRELKLKPILYELQLKTNTPFSTSMLINIYSLMPGTVSMGLENSKLLLHILDEKLLDEKFILSTQDRVVEVFERNRI